MKEYKFSTEDIKKLTKSMVILVDSREQKNGHILDYFKKQGIPYQVTKLDYGDYSFMLPAAAGQTFISIGTAWWSVRGALRNCLETWRRAGTDLKRNFCVQEMTDVRFTLWWRLQAAILTSLAIDTGQN